MSLPMAAALAAAMLFALAIFHGALALGVPWGAFAWGGENEGQLSPRLQLGSTLMAPFVAVMGLILLVRGGWLYTAMAPDMSWAAWAIFLFAITQMFGAFRSKSLREKRRMAPLYAIGAALTAIVAFGGTA